MSITRIWLAATLFAGLGSLSKLVASTGGSVIFETDHVQIDTTAGDDSIQFAAIIRNNTNEAVTIVDIRSDCECITAQAGEQTMLPGEASCIQIKADLHEKTGTLDRKIQVTTTSSETRSLSFNFRVNIMPEISQDKNSLIWRIGETSSPKSVALKYSRSGHICWATSGEAKRFVTTVHVLDNNCVVQVTPLHTRIKCMQDLKLECATSDGRHIICHLFLFIL